MRITSSTSIAPNGAALNECKDIPDVGGMPIRILSK